jgi:transposase-like protein
VAGGEQTSNSLPDEAAKSESDEAETGKSPARKRRPIPAEYNGVQVNFCRTPSCENFGKPPLIFRGHKGGRGNRETSPDGYKVVGERMKKSALSCQLCKSQTRLKSNKAVVEERDRQARHIMATPLTNLACPKPECVNHEPKGPLSECFHSHGVTRHGNPRFRCRACGTTLSISGPSAKQRRKYLSAKIAVELVNNAPLNRIAEKLGCSFNVLYGKIDHIYRQCVAFAAERERRMFEMTFGEVNLSTDCQHYMVNWGSRKRRETIQLMAIATAERDSGYVFGLVPNFDPDLTPEEVEAGWKAAGDGDKAPHLREWARVWTQADYAASVAKTLEYVKKKDGKETPRTGELVTVFDVAREDLDLPEAIVEGQQLPPTGVQVHADYMAHGHFQLLSHMFFNAKQVNLFIDGDAGLLTACLGAFAPRVASGRAHVVQVVTPKDLNTEVRRTRYAASLSKFKAYINKNHAGLPWEMARVEVMREHLNGIRGTEDGLKWDIAKEWIDNPLPDSSEPEKQFRFVTDTGAISNHEVARLLERATLWPIDTVFNQIRYRVRMFGRPVPSARRARKMWHAYCPYDPNMVVQLLEIYRVWHNYIWHEDKPKRKADRTPAEKLGLAKGEVRWDHILGYDERKKVKAATKGV